MPIHQVLRLGRGAIIELDASEEDAVSILANNLPVAKGTVVVNGNRIAVSPNCFGDHLTCVDRTATRVSGCTKIKSSAGRVAGLVPQHPICYMVRHHRDAGFLDPFVLLPMRSWRNW